MDNKIHILSEEVANKIAAGEVVERPASVVKELLENSVDAGATEIIIEVNERLDVVVTDNGCGMSRGDVITSLAPHATSKIHTVEDIDEIQTFGFRGEAIPSIASVSRMTITSCSGSDEGGTKVCIEAGKVVSVEDIGFPVGTEIIVRDLFFNVPARKSFMKGVASETARIKEVVTQEALAHPKIKIVLKTGKRRDVIFDLPAGDLLQERILGIFGVTMSDKLYKIDYTRGNIKYSGFVGANSCSYLLSGEQYTFVNGRPASAKNIFGAINELFPGVKKNERPPLFLFIDLPYKDVFVNVHPTKNEVKFRDGWSVGSGIVDAVQKAWGMELHEEESSPYYCETKIQIQPFLPIQNRQPYEGSSSHTAPTLTPDYTANNAHLSTYDIGNGYAIVKTQNGISVIDIRRAWERILYERLITESQNGGIISQQLLTPEIVQVDADDAERLAESLVKLNKCGFEIALASSDGCSFKIDAIPAGLDKLLPIRDAIYNIANSISSTFDHSRIIRIIAKNAQSMGSLSPMELNSLVNKLVTLENYTQSPIDNKPIIYTITYSDLNNHFGRR